MGGKRGSAHYDRSARDSNALPVIFSIHDAQGIAHRFEWIKKHLGMEDEELFNYERKFKRTILALEEIPSHHPILIWLEKIRTSKQVYDLLYIY